LLGRLSNLISIISTILSLIVGSKSLPTTWLWFSTHSLLIWVLLVAWDYYLELCLLFGILLMARIYCLDYCLRLSNIAWGYYLNFCLWLGIIAWDSGYCLGFCLWLGFIAWGFAYGLRICLRLGFIAWDSAYCLGLYLLVFNSLCFLFYRWNSILPSRPNIQMLFLVQLGSISVSLGG
jgi:hypothetical protein